MASTTANTTAGGVSQEDPINPRTPSTSSTAATNTTPDAKREQRITVAACFLGLVASVGGFMFGYVSGQISGFFLMEDYLERFGEVKIHSDGSIERYFSAVRQGTIVGLLSVGCLFGCLIAGRLADVIGRRMTISASAFFSCVGIVIQISSNTSWAQFAVGRLVDGLGIGALSVAVPMYQSESSPAIIRGVIVSCYQLFVTLGIWTSNMVNYGTNEMSGSSSWRIPNGLGFAWALVLGVGILLLPESPRYAFLNGREDEARNTIARLAGVEPNAPSVNAEISEIREKVDQMKEGADAKWYEVFTGPRMFYRLLLGILLQSGQQLTGANFFFYYGTTVFQATGLNDSYVTQVILGSVNVACTFGGLVVVKKCGRRSALITGALWMMMCFLVYAFVGHFKLDDEDPTRTPQAGTILIAFSCLFIAGFATTWGPLVWAVVAEMYPARYRSTAMGIATASNWLWNFLISFFTRFIVDEIEWLYGLVFAGCCLALAIIVFFTLNESKDRSLEEIDTMYITRVNPITSSKWKGMETEAAHKEEVTDRS
ncbi:sugar transporter domain-containing protein [Sarocladium implicatum]|nr:sugar transporter domain-containing protein [Sarocladium implicatum]